MRIKFRAEVFTPAWICNLQNNAIDEMFLGVKNVFNIPSENRWITNHEKIQFPGNLKWQKYVDDKRLEITCGEAPYLVSRYDATSGKIIPVHDRIGILDRKLRIVNENAIDDKAWNYWVVRAIQSVYGYEFQGDSLLIARENILFTFIDFYQNRYFKNPTVKELEKIANIISWNIWQMDGIKGIVPYSDTLNSSPIFCKIFDWRDKSSCTYNSTIRGEQL
jgi:hypothetical protein